MRETRSSQYEYQVGGSLPVDSPTYVMRQADHDLYRGLRAAKFCYVLNSRQMGKSSLRIQVMRRLKADGIACASIDLTKVGSRLVTQEQWYYGIIRLLLQSFDSFNQIDLRNRFNQEQWWNIHNRISPVQRFSEFLETVLLAELSQNIVIFVDEIDSVLSLNFAGDDFFAVIRSLYNNRADNPACNRITFALFGVADPSDLIQDKTRTPFNIGESIQLDGFELANAQPLARGLIEKTDDPELTLQAIWEWSNGQPFLTQKICKLIKESPSSIPKGEEENWVADLVKKRIVENWEVQDSPEHLKTIVNRILMSPTKRTARLLSMYQQVLQHGGIAAAETSEQIELRLSGLVVERNGYLRVYNRIYSSVFTQEWVDKVLASLRPYSEMITAWFGSACQDESRLLRGQALRDALTWSAGKSLSDRDYQFLAASQELENREIEQALATEKEANQILSEAQRKAQKRVSQGVAILVGTGILAAVIIGLVILVARNEGRKAVEAEARAQEAEKRTLEVRDMINLAQEKASQAESKAELAERRVSTAEAALREAENNIVETRSRLDTENKQLKQAMEQVAKVREQAEAERARADEALRQVQAQQQRAEEQRRIAEERLVEVDRQRKIAEARLRELEKLQKNATQNSNQSQ